MLKSMLIERQTGAPRDRCTSHQRKKNKIPLVGKQVRITNRKKLWCQAREGPVHPPLLVRRVTVLWCQEGQSYAPPRRADDGGLALQWRRFKLLRLLRRR
jgi:hypothetical protein